MRFARSRFSCHALARRNRVEQSYGAISSAIKTSTNACVIVVVRVCDNQLRNRKCDAPDGQYGRLVSACSLAGLDGGEVDIALQNPFGMIEACCQQGPYFNGVLERAMARSPCTAENPWRIVLFAMLSPSSRMHARTLADDGTCICERRSNLHVASHVVMLDRVGIGEAC